MLYREIIAVCSQIHTKHTNTLCGQKVEMLNVKLAVHNSVLHFKRLMSIGSSLNCTWKQKQTDIWQIVVECTEIFTD